MEERLKYAVESLKSEGSPELIRERLLMLLGASRHHDSTSSIYLQARAKGLSISEAELGVALFEALRSIGPELLAAKLEKSDQIKQKRKRRKIDDETKRKPKLNG